jgi:sec-independent protein translocase protein TatB
MFGMGFTEILFIAVIAIIFLGPDKLPEAMVQIAKFFNSFKKSVSEAKSTFENEIHMNELREEALSYKRTIDSDISGFKNSLSNPIDDLNEALADLDEKKSEEKRREKEYTHSQKPPQIEEVATEKASDKETAKQVTAKKKSKTKKKKKSAPKGDT